MSANDLLEFTKIAFHKMNRTLTEEQRQILSDKISSLPQPLYTQLVSEGVHCTLICVLYIQPVSVLPLHSSNE